MGPHTTTPVAAEFVCLHDRFSSLDVGQHEARLGAPGRGVGRDRLLQVMSQLKLLDRRLSCRQGVPLPRIVHRVAVITARLARPLVRPSQCRPPSPL